MTRLQSHDNPANSALKIAKVNIAYGVLLLYHNSMCLCVCDDFNVHDIVCSYHIGWQTLYLVFIVSGKIGLFSKKMRVTKKTLTPSDFHSANQRSAVFLLLVIGSRIKNGVQRTWDAPTIRQLIDLIICAMYFSLIKNH